MAIWSWITHRTDAVGWESWKHVERIAGLSEEDTLNLRDVDDFGVLAPRKRCALARALCTTVKQMRLLDCGEQIDAPVDRERLQEWQRARAAGVDFDDWQEPAAPPPGTPVLGIMSARGLFEPDLLDQLPTPYGRPGTVFALRNFAGDYHAVYRLTSTERWCEGEWVAAYVIDDGDGRGYVGRVHLVNRSVELQLRDNTRVRIPTERVARLAKEICTDPPPLNATPFPVPTRPDVTPAAPKADRPCGMLEMAKIRLGTPTKEVGDDEPSEEDPTLFDDDDKPDGAGHGHAGDGHDRN